MAVKPRYGAPKPTAYRLAEQLNDKDAEIARLRERLAAMDESGTGYSQQTLDAVTAERDSLRELLQTRTAEAADLEATLTEIAELCGCAEWEYRWQIIRDVESLIRERDVAEKFHRVAVLERDEARAELAQSVPVARVREVLREIQATGTGEQSRTAGYIAEDLGIDLDAQDGEGGD